MTRLTHREAAEAVLAGKALSFPNGGKALGKDINLTADFIDRLSYYVLAAPTPQPTEAPMWTPETNRIMNGLLTADERKALEAAEHGWLIFGNGYWSSCEYPIHAERIYRAKPAPAPTLSITVNGVTNVVAAPVTEALKQRAYYWMPNPLIGHLTAAATWDDDDVDRERMKRGLIHITEAAARAHAMALVGLKAEGV